jgi:hypothetical protein
MAFFRFKYMVPAHKLRNASLLTHAGKSGQLTDGRITVNRLKAFFGPFSLHGPVMRLAIAGGLTAF